MGKIIYDTTITITVNNDVETGRPARLFLKGHSATRDILSIVWVYQIKSVSGSWLDRVEMIQLSEPDDLILYPTMEAINKTELQLRNTIEPATYDTEGLLLTPAVMQDLDYYVELEFLWMLLSEKIQGFKELLTDAGERFALRKNLKGLI